MKYQKPAVRALALGTTGALVAGLIAAAGPASAATSVDKPPLKTVSNSLNGPIGMENDAAGNLYIASQLNNSIVVHPKNATGASAPSRRIFGPATTLVSPRDVALDSNGFVYVIQLNGTVRVFSPAADGNVAPVKSFGTGGANAWSIEISGGEIYVRRTDSINVYPLSATGSPATPDRSITGLATGRSLSVAGNKVWTQAGTQLRAYSTGATGAAVPVRNIVNAFNMNEVNGIDVDSNGRVYATSFDDKVVVYGPNADGAASPLKVLGGPASTLDGPTGVVVLPGKSLAVANYLVDNYTVYSTLFPKVVTKPGKVRNLRVKGKARAKKRIVRWKAPASDGGATITRYRIVIKKGNKTLRVRTVGKNRRSLVVKRNQLRKGVNKVYVQAKNSKGYGPKKMKKFRVRK